MRILLTNDDGIDAAGIHALAKALSLMGEVFCVAPHYEQSGTGHGITIKKPLSCYKVDHTRFPHAKEAWAVGGTPADCVKLAVDRLLDAPPDLVVSGINHGWNMGTDVLYSGTVSGALEGYINGISAVSVSLTAGRDDFYLAASLTLDICRRYKDTLLNSHKMLNVNIPDLPQGEIKGVRLCSLGARLYRQVFNLQEQSADGCYFTLKGILDDSQAHPQSDIVALSQGYITVTPLKWDLTDYDDLRQLQKLIDGADGF